LYIYEKNLAEIRSLVIDEAFHGQGQGVAMVQYLLEFAHQMELQEILVLTYIPDYFGRLGFVHIDKNSLADNIIEDSEPSPHKDPEDEVAMKYFAGGAFAKSASANSTSAKSTMEKNSLAGQSQTTGMS
jgi:argininosuccinate lyase/amino-acid N-acetyltransferase